MASNNPYSHTFTPCYKYTIGDETNYYFPEILFKEQVYNQIVTGVSIHLLHSHAIPFDIFHMMIKFVTLYMICHLLHSHAVPWVSCSLRHHPGLRAGGSAPLYPRIRPGYPPSWHTSGY